MTDPKHTLSTTACLESHRSHKDYLYETLGSVYMLCEPMPEGKHRNRLLDEIGKLDVIAGEISKA